jgi:pristinamycin I synthase 3 and 4
VLILNVHHIVSDGTSMGILVRDLSEIYKRYRMGLPSLLSDLPLQYADYAAWQRAWFSSPALENESSYWQEKLAGAPTSSYVPAKPSRPARPSARAAGQTVTISSATSAKLHAFAQRHSVSIFVVLLSAFKCVLARLSGNTDIVVATPVAQRRFVALEQVCGHFTNTLLLRTEVHPSEPLGEIVDRVQKTLVEAFAHQDLPFGYLMSQLFPERLPGDPAPYQLMFNMIPAEVSDLRLLDIAVTPLEGQTEEQGKIDLTMYVSTLGSEIRIVSLYKTDVFADETMTNMLEIYRNVLEDVAGIGNSNDA